MPWAATLRHSWTVPILAGLNDADLDRKVDLPFAGFGPQSLGWIVSNVALGHLHNHTGEISALKGVQGGKGYPF